MQMSESTKRLPYDLNGRVALITGANHGIGAATAKALAGCGASVLVSYLRQSPGISQRSLLWRGQGGTRKLHHVRCV